VSPAGDSQPDTNSDPNCRFLTNQARAIILVAGDPDLRIRDIASRIGITERAAQRILADLEDAGYLTHHKIGRRNRYTVHIEGWLMHCVEEAVEFGHFLELFLPGPKD